MREKIQIGVGQGGVNISSQFGKMITKEHGLDLEGLYIGDNDDQLKSINGYFNETSKQNYVPRSFLIDLDSRSIDSVMGGECSKLFSEESYISGLNGSSGNWGQAYYISGKDLQDFIMDNIRKEAERGDGLETFEIIHSISGGTGSGLGSLILDELGAEWPITVMSNGSVFPSK